MAKKMRKMKGRKKLGSKTMRRQMVESEFQEVDQGQKQLYGTGIDDEGLNPGTMTSSVVSFLWNILKPILVFILEVYILGDLHCSPKTNYKPIYKEEECIGEGFLSRRYTGGCPFRTNFFLHLPSSSSSSFSSS
ncbi:hypothetical protein POM88_010279 [Heracleum sosnowskyi]|uniref:Uncharacterized protein n=1 Tax=Heracleum sosnowskyi TaxID=360622 RepID=A0AAD8IU37_9APIA|nr:hypothetical protein POM88_010279 [Heracleum sosnowskyi]